MTSDVSERLKKLMMREGALIIFGPHYLNATLQLVNGDNQKAVFSCLRIDDVEVPDTLMINCALLFCHTLPWCVGRGVTRPDLAKWSTALLDGIILRPQRVPGLEPDEIEEPSRKFVADETTDDVMLLIGWGPVPSNHCVNIARALDRAYSKNGGKW
ncbi:MAG TPA: hypothetical protein VKT70_09710 [Stellaceae bacterium]|nr:hypothetical protein [Stellaceae bacterium]